MKTLAFMITIQIIDTVSSCAEIPLVLLKKTKSDRSLVDEF